MMRSCEGFVCGIGNFIASLEDCMDRWHMPARNRMQAEDHLSGAREAFDRNEYELAALLLISAYDEIAWCFMQRRGIKDSRVNQHRNVRRRGGR